MLRPEPGLSVPMSIPNAGRSATACPGPSCRRAQEVRGSVWDRVWVRASGSFLRASPGADVLEEESGKHSPAQEGEGQGVSVRGATGPSKESWTFGGARVRAAGRVYGKTDGNDEGPSSDTALQSSRRLDSRYHSSPPPGGTATGSAHQKERSGTTAGPSREGSWFAP